MVVEVGIDVVVETIAVDVVDTPRPAAGVAFDALFVGLEVQPVPNNPKTAKVLVVARPSLKLLAGAFDFMTVELAAPPLRSSICSPRFSSPNFHLSVPTIQ